MNPNSHTNTPILATLSFENLSRQELCDWITALHADLAAASSGPEGVEEMKSALRAICYEPGDYKEIAHRNYCRWCHYAYDYPHGDNCVMRFVDPPTPGATEG